ncbi:hypothetical protein LBMAG53_22410 [Planctomycetota bacterium]|nr:hypothetical protein LBMAG53_22410 [Planctomycetota bacterium]
MTQRSTAISAFTAIELLVVLSIMLILLGLGVSGVMSTMRRAAVNQAVVAITSTAEKARSMSMTADNLGGGVATVFGVVINADPATTGSAFVALTMGQRNDGLANDHLSRVAIMDTTETGTTAEAFTSHAALSQMNGNTGLLSSTGTVRPVMVHKLKTTAIPYVLNAGAMVPLRSAAVANRGWYYHQSTGALIGPPTLTTPNWPIDATPCEMGRVCSQRTWNGLWKKTGQLAVSGRTWDYTVPNLLSGMTVTVKDSPFKGLQIGDEVPGLSIATQDGSYRVGIRGSAIGQLVARSF